MEERVFIVPGNYSYDKWIPIVDFIGLKNETKRDWLIKYLQKLEREKTDEFMVEVESEKCNLLTEQLLELSNLNIELNEEIKNSESKIQWVNLDDKNKVEKLSKEIKRLNENISAMSYFQFRKWKKQYKQNNKQNINGTKS